MGIFKLSRTGEPPLEFRGTQLVDLPGTDDGSTGGRCTDLSLFRAEDGQYIVSVNFRSSFGGERDDDFVEIADTEDEVEAILSLYNPADRLDAGLFDRSESGHRRAVASKLVRRYDEQVANLLCVLDQVASGAIVDPARPTESN